MGARAAVAAVADPRPVLVFDSGLGGLSVLRAIRALLPERRYVFLADDAGFPYGERMDDELVSRVVELIDEAVTTYDPAGVVIACNTASTLVLPPLRARFAVPFVGTVPAIKPAAAQSRTGIVAVLATPGTMKRDYTRALIARYSGRCHVRLVGAPDLAAMAERHLAGGAVDPDALAQQISPCFVTLDGQRTDIVALACTHYPFLIDQMAAAAPWPVSWLDPAPAIARQVARVIGSVPQSAHSQRECENLAVFTSGRPASPAITRFLGQFGLRTKAAARAV